MKTLFKNSFKTFFKSKVVITLVSLIVFLTIGIFTLLTSSIISFRYSYDQVISENKLHDFTAKEKYDLSGELGFEKGAYEQINGEKVFIKDKTDIQDFTKENPNSKTFSTDAQYIYFDYANGNPNSDNDILKKGFLNIYDEIITKNIFFVETSRTQKKANNVIVRFNKDDLLMLYDINKKKDVNNLVKKIFLQKNPILFDILYKNNSSANFSLDKLSHKKTDYESNGLVSYVENQINSKNYSWTSKSSLKIENFTNVEMQLYKSNDQIFLGEQYTYVKNSTNKDDFINWMKEKLNKDKYYAIDKDVEVYQIAPSVEKSSGVFKNLLKEIPGESAKNSTKKKIENWIISNGLDATIKSNDPLLLSKIDKKKSLLKTFIKSFVIKAKRENYLSRINSLYEKYLDYRIFRSVNISDKSRNFKIVEFSKNDKINKLKIFEGYSMPKKYTDSQMQDLMNEQLKLKKVFVNKESNVSNNFGIGWSETVKNSRAKIFKDKSFKWIAKWKENYVYNVLGFQVSSNYIPKSSYVLDPSSYFAYVSPGHVKANKIQFVNPQKIMNNPTDIKKMILNPKYIYDKYPNSTITMGKVKFLVIGSAIQPDYSFPIISSSHPVPNIKKEAIIFANKNGYLKAEDSYRGNEKENYISFRWKDNVDLSDDKKNDILYNSPKIYNSKNELVATSIESISRELMNWPKNIRIISKNNDTSEQIILSPHRTVFLIKLKNMIEIVAFITIAMLLFATMLLIGIFIKKHINSNKKQFGILLANGYSKHQIALSNIVFPLIVMVIPSIAGYVLGFLFQNKFIDIFKDYWTLPINAETYSWVSSTLYIGGPFILVIIFSYFISRWELRRPITEILSGASSKQGSFLSNIFINMFSWIGIKNKISISLFFTNLSKMLMILVVSTTSIITLSVGFTNIGKFSYAQNVSEKMNNYNFSINLITPTDEGGLMKRASLKNNFGIDLKQSTDEIYETLSPKAAKVEAKEPTWFIPNTSDEQNSKGIKYLDNKIQFQSLMNTILGKGYSNTNPWKASTESLIPEGQKLVSNKQRKIFNQYGVTLEINKKFKDEKWFKDIKNTKIGVPLPENTGGLTSMSNTYLKFIINTIRNISNDFDAKKKYLPTFITYKTILMDTNDETYTYIDATYTGKNISSKTSVDRITIFGLKTNTKMVNIPKYYLNKLDSYKPTSKGEVPILVNSYFSDIYNINLNDSIKLDINNKSNRNFVSNSDKSLFKVVGIVESYNNSKIYTTQKVANKILGIDKLRFNTQTSEAFNGIFTKSEFPIVLQSIPLYAESGYYPGIDSLSESDDLIKKIFIDIKTNGSEKVKNKIKNELDYINLYSKSPYVASYSTIDWTKMSQYAFDSTLNLSVKIIFIVETLAILFSIIFIIIITMMIISDNKKFISTLKVMGYKTKSINKIFFKSIIPSLVIAILIAIPFVFAILLGMKLAIVSFGHILIPLDMFGWEIITAVAITFIISAIIYYSSTQELKNKSVLEAFIT